MASYHLSIKSGKRGKAANHAAYIAREGKYGKNRDLVAMEYGNFPEWATGKPYFFWKMADANERVNGATYREFELALPRELTIEQQRALLDEFICHEIGDKPYQLAIHAPIAALGGVDQPHAHIMVSDRIQDGIERSPEQHFKRYNSAHPELGGCKKDSGGKDRATLKGDLKMLRANWAEYQNHALKKHGHSARVDARSYQDRGIGLDAERHLGHLGIKTMTVDEKAQYKANRHDTQQQSV